MNINLTLIGQLIAFGVFVWFCKAYVWPPIMKALEERKAKIAEGLAAAERGKHEQQLGEQRAKEVLKEAKQQAAGIIAQAEKRAGEIEDEGKEKGRAEGARMVTAAQSEIEQEANRAREELRGRVAGLALEAVEKILEREVDADVHSEFLAKQAAKL